MITTTIIIPVSRLDYLDRLFASLELLHCEQDQVALLTYVDGKADVFVAARNFTAGSKFAQKLCIQRRPDNQFREFDINRRRYRIAAIHNEVKRYIGDCKYIFGIEDDTIVPPNALERLLFDYSTHPYAGFIEGVELGRWGIPYVGAWTADDVYEPTKLETLMPPVADITRPIDPVQEIDSGGFYCFLTKRDHYLNHEFTVFGENDLGPDVQFGLAMRQHGRKNYLDWSIKCEHRYKEHTGEQILTISNTTPKRVIMTKEERGWKRTVTT